MTDLNIRIQNAKKEITGNEALLDMLDADAAADLLNWGIAAAERVAMRTDGMEDSAAEAVLAPGVKAVRQSMRSIGNWAAGKYSDPEARGQLREKLIEQFMLMFGEGATLPSAADWDTLLNLADEAGNNPQMLISKFKDLAAITG